MSDTADWTPPASQADIAALSAKIDTVSANTGLLTNISSITQVSVQVTATLLRTTSGREGVILYNNSATVTVWVGDSSIVSGQGTPIPPETPMAFGLNGAELWGVGDVGVAVVNVSHGIIA